MTNREAILAKMKEVIKNYRKEIRKNRSLLAEELRMFGDNVERGCVTKAVIPSTATTIASINRDEGAVDVMERMVMWIKCSTND